MRVFFVEPWCPVIKKKRSGRGCFRKGVSGGRERVLVKNLKETYVSLQEQAQRPRKERRRGGVVFQGPKTLSGNGTNDWGGGEEMEKSAGAYFPVAIKEEE